MSSAEEIEVNVRQIEETPPPAEQPMMVFDVMRKLLLAGVGAVALTRDEVEAFLNRLVERGEIAQKDAQRLLDETMSKFRNVGQSRVAQAESQVSSISVQVENNLEQFLNRLNIPSKRDIDELSAKIAELAARVEELRLVQEQSARGGFSEKCRGLARGAGCGPGDAPGAGDCLCAPARRSSGRSGLMQPQKTCQVRHAVSACRRYTALPHLSGLCLPPGRYIGPVRQARSRPGVL